MALPFRTLPRTQTLLLILEMLGTWEGGPLVCLFNASKEIRDVSNQLGTPDGYKPRIGEVREGTPRESPYY